MEPVAGASAFPQYQAAAPQTVTYQTMPAQASVTYGAPQVVSERVVSQAAPIITHAAPQYVSGGSVSYIQQPAQEVSQAPVTYIQQAAPQEPAGSITYSAAPTMQAPVTYTTMTQPGTMTYTQGAATQFGAVQSPMYFPMSVQQAWDNHFAAFGAQDLDKIMLDYDETSIVRVYFKANAQKAEHRGTAQIRAMFAALFKDLPDLTTLAAPVVDVEEDPGQVFLVWKCPGSGFDLATDTFIFGADKKIKRQNIVVDKMVGFVAQASNAVGAAAAAAPTSTISSAKASKKKDKGSKKKLGSKKKKGGFC